MSNKNKIKIVGISGSMREGSNTLKALHIVFDELKKYKLIDIDLIDPLKLTLSFPGQTELKAAKMIQKTVAEADGVILATPEYHGSYSSVIKLIIDNLGYPSTLSGKPIALLGVASGQIGAIKALEHLRSVCAHVGAIVLPNVISIAAAGKTFDDQGKCLDQGVDKRLRVLATKLVEFIEKHVCLEGAVEEWARKSAP